MINQGLRNRFLLIATGICLIIPLPNVLGAKGKDQYNASGQAGAPSSNGLSDEKRKELKSALKFLLENQTKLQANVDVGARIEALEESVDRLDAAIEILREQNKLVIQRTTLGFRDQFYVKLGISIVLPRPRTFSFQTETGFGAYLGLGKYFGRSHVIEGAAEWDIYPSLALRYRYEFQSAMPALTWGPLIGIKGRVINAGPLDGSISNPDELKSMYWMVGGVVGFPISRSLFSVEFLYLINQQSFFFINGAFNFYW